MMKIHVMAVVHEGELTSSAHLTEKGAAIAGILDMLDFLGVNDKEDAIRVMGDRFCGHLDEKPPDDASITWDLEEMRQMKIDDLWKVFRQWCECTWDNQYGYNVAVNTTTLQA